MFSYTIPTRQNIARGPYQRAFSELYPKLFADMLNREPGTLFDPLLNTSFSCTPNMFDDTTDPTKRDGTDVQVEFKRDVPLGEEDTSLVNLSGVAGLTSQARSLDDEVARADWKQEPAPEPSVDALQAADGVLSQGLAQVGKATASLHDFAYKMEKLEATCDRAENPENWGIRDAARRNREAAIALNRRLTESPATKLRRLTTQTAQLVADVAKEAGMTLEELLRLNPSLARLPYIPAGTPVTIRVQSAAA
ncbi:MAG TPA: hypothetical protein VFR23_24690 [Jiangellaceae bacterium]|nr:hypothetical protein [Jiangellaceae bacterium]